MKDKRKMLAKRRLKSKESKDRCKVRLKQRRRYILILKLREKLDQD